MYTEEKETARDRAEYSSRHAGEQNGELRDVRHPTYPTNMHVTPRGPTDQLRLRRVLPPQNRPPTSLTPWWGKMSGRGGGRAKICRVSFIKTLLLLFYREKVFVTSTVVRVKYISLNTLMCVSVNVYVWKHLYQAGIINCMMIIFSKYMLATTRLA